jgi:hypothetical protein
VEDVRQQQVRASWTAANDSCRNDGPVVNAFTHLAVPDDQDELDRIHQLSMAFNVWVGIAAPPNEAVFHPIITSPPDFPPPAQMGTSPPWIVGEPTNIDAARCVFVQTNGTTTGLLGNEACNVEHAYLCECDGSSVDPAALPP